MITYERLEAGQGKPRDVKVTIDDSQGEMASLEDAFMETDATEMQTYANIQAATRGDDGNFEFIIPGDEVGEVSDLFYEVDNGQLDRLMDQWNEETLRELAE